VVYTNCAGFVRIRRRYFQQRTYPHHQHQHHQQTNLRTSGSGSGQEFGLHPLDDTRIHPDDYSLVKKMAVDALESEIDDEEDLIGELMEHPQKLDEIDLDAFADELEKKGAKKRALLYFIKQEINEPFRDPRADYRDPDPLELFRMMTGETDLTLHRGQLQSARVISVSERGVLCRLDNGLLGIVDEEDFEGGYRRGSENSIRPTLGVREGQLLCGRIKRVDKESMTVWLSCDPNVVSSKHWEQDHLQTLKDKESYLIIHEEDDPDANYRQQRLAEAARRARKKRKKLFPKRVVEHPFFRCVPCEEAERILSEKPNGELIIRPSSKGYAFLNITWKLSEDLFVHVTIAEQEKPDLLSIGKRLLIGQEVFEDLDEILARHLEPIIAFSQEMMRFRGFQLGHQEDIVRRLQDEKRKNLLRIPYFVHLSYDRPGKFLLSYLPNQRVRTEFISVIPEGFRFRNQTFTKPEKLISWFKAHFKDSTTGPISASSSMRPVTGHEHSRHHTRVSSTSSENIVPHRVHHPSAQNSSFDSSIVQPPSWGHPIGHDLPVPTSGTSIPLHDVYPNAASASSSQQQPPQSSSFLPSYPSSSQASFFQAPPPQDRSQHQQRLPLSNSSRDPNYWTSGNWPGFHTESSSSPSYSSSSYSNTNSGMNPSASDNYNQPDWFSSARTAKDFPYRRNDRRDRDFRSGNRHNRDFRGGRQRFGDSSYR